MPPTQKCLFCTMLTWLCLKVLIYCATSFYIAMFALSEFTCLIQVLLFIIFRSRMLPYYVILAYLSRFTLFLIAAGCWELPNSIFICLQMTNKCLMSKDEWREELILLWFEQYLFNICGNTSELCYIWGGGYCSCKIILSLLREIFRLSGLIFYLFGVYWKYS